VESYGLAGNLLDWLRSFLKARSRVNGETSIWYNVLSEVPPRL